MTYTAICDCGATRTVTRKANSGNKKCRSCAAKARDDFTTDERNYITFACNAKGCNNTKTILKVVYAQRDRHFCCRKCSYANRGKYKKQVELTTKEKIEQYFRRKDGKV